jgi:hypothetical protein
MTDNPTAPRTISEETPAVPSGLAADGGRVGVASSGGDVGP